MFHLITDVHYGLVRIKVFQVTIVADLIYKFLIENVLEPFIQMVVAGDIKLCYGHRFKCTVLVVTF